MKEDNGAYPSDMLPSVTAVTCERAARLARGEPGWGGGAGNVLRILRPFWGVFYMFIVRTRLTLADEGVDLVDLPV